jgi:glycosyltransferase involved in cell wall biosynthesis
MEAPTERALEAFRDKVRILREENKGVAAARNVLCEHAHGEILAFIDADDLWHPSYLEAQQKLFQDHPTACAYFAWHVSFPGYGTHAWDPELESSQNSVDVLGPLEFLNRYNTNTGQFASMSYCCLRREVLARIGSAPFRLRGCEDSYLCTLLPLFGHVAFNPKALVAYRVTDSSTSVDRLKKFGLWVQVFELLERRYKESGERTLETAFRAVFASKRRQYGKLLMAAERFPEARQQFRHSLQNSAARSSLVKSGLLFLATYLPRFLQPKRPPLQRRWREQS